MESSRLRDVIIGIVLLLIGGGTLLHTLGVIELNEETVTLAGIYGFAGLGALLLLAYFFRTDKVWMMIIAFCLFFMASVIWVLNFTDDDQLVGVALFLLTALAFLLVFIRNRRQWWALLVTWTSLGLAAVVFMESSNFRLPAWTGLQWTPELQGLLFLGSIALGFFFVWLADVRRLWWALMTAGLTPAVCAPVGARAFGYTEEIGAVLLFLISGFVFFLLWLIRNDENELGWAIYPAAVLFPFSAFLYMLIFWRGHSQVFLSVTFIFIGLIFIISSFVKRKQIAETDKYRVYTTTPDSGTVPAPGIQVTNDSEPPYVEAELPRPEPPSPDPREMLLESQEEEAAPLFTEKEPESGEPAGGEEIEPEETLDEEKGDEDKDGKEG